MSAAIKVTVMVVGALGAIMVASTLAQAASTDWMKPSEASSFAKSLIKSNGTMLSIQCKDSGKPGKVNDMALVKLTFDPKPKVGWSWGIGDKSWFTKTSAQRAAQGFKRVSYSNFTRKGSGVSIQCAVWHK